MTPASDADRWPDPRTPLELLAHFSEGLGRAADLPGQLRLTADVLRQILGNVTITYCTPGADHWQPVAWDGQEPLAATSLAADLPPLIGISDVPEPVFSGENALYPFSWEGQPCGLLRVALPAGRGWTGEERAVFRAVGGALALALRRDAAQDRRRNTGRQGDDEAALDIFAAFTERAAAETDVLALSREAYAVLDAHFSDYASAYYEIQDGQWKALTWTRELSPEQITMIRAGLPLDAPSFARAMETRQPVFIDGWDPESEQIDNTADFGLACIYPLVVGTRVRGIFTVGLRVGETWRGRDRGLMRALGRSLTLALERAQSVRWQARQNAELQARTRTLEAFEALSRELSLDADPYLLVRRAQDIALSLMPPGFALYYEPEGELFRLKAQTGSFGNDALQQVVDAGLPYHTTLNLRRPYESGQPYYQDHYDSDTDQLGELADSVGATATLPIMVAGRVCGVLAVGLDESKPWTATERTLLETMARSLGLALDRAEQTRQLQEERAALAAFMALTESVGSETDVLSLIRQAAVVLAEAHDVDVTYSEREGELFKIRVWPPGFPADLLAETQAGYRPNDPGFEAAQRTRQSVFMEDIGGRPDGRPGVALYRALAFQPFFQGETMTGMLIMASRRQGRWPERERAVFRAVGRSLGLALERAEDVRRLARSNAELQVAVDELEAFAYSVSHDLRTPVRHIKGFNALLRARIMDSTDLKASHYLGVIDDAASRMNTLIDAMLDLSRTTRHPLRVEDVDLAALVTSVQVELTAEQGARSLEWRVGPLPLLSADRHLLRQVMVNLLSNAVKYTRTRAQAVIEIRAEERPGAWTVLVRDNGVGFDPRYTDRLFGVFQRLHHEREFEGTGVGLANVRRIVTRHGGTVAAETEEGQGATFSFTLPR
ncbi:ATP-binding protein [Deinococcus marmoris]|uniref:histidine kinase n=1 Tax=Deinococcus marmoris TaxID=249408 RepID=A0A1U7NXR9_9DEIO|nr:ATP-binding protein [Deinococcus marmoris]OLV17722.1 Phytochrome, two-component sensor histidine kinase [Deinococcus marmoris]